MHEENSWNEHFRRKEVSGTNGQESTDTDRVHIKQPKEEDQSHESGLYHSGLYVVVIRNGRPEEGEWVVVEDQKGQHDSEPSLDNTQIAGNDGPHFLVEPDAGVDGDKHEYQFEGAHRVLLVAW